MSDTILEYLCRENTKIDLRSKPRGSTRNLFYPQPRDIRRSEWLKRDHLEQMFDGILSEVLGHSADGLEKSSKSQRPAAATESGCASSDDEAVKIHSEANLKSLLDETMMHRVRQALQHDSCVAFLQQKTDLRREGDRKESIMFFSEGAKRGPDFTGVRDVRVQPAADDGEGQPHCLLPGEVKLSSVLDSKKMEGFLQRLSSAKSKEARFSILGQMWPFRQLLKYCLESFTRYGWILTDDEIFLIRIHLPLDETPVAGTDQALSNWLWNRAHMEYFPVKWNARGTENTFTICLALWFLHVLATNNGHISREPYLDLLEERLIPLDQQKRLYRDPQMSRSDYRVLQESSFEGETATSSPTMKTRAMAKRASVSEVDSFEVTHSSYSLVGSFGSEGFKRRREAEGEDDDGDVTEEERLGPEGQHASISTSSLRTRNTGNPAAETNGAPRIMPQRQSQRGQRQNAQQQGKRIRTTL